MGSVNFNTSYDAFRHIQSTGSGSVGGVGLKGTGDESKLTFVNAGENAGQSKKVRETFANAVKFELDGGNVGKSDKQLRAEKIASTFKTIGKVLGLALLACTGIGAVGIVTVAVCKHFGEKHLRDIVQTDAIARAVDPAEFLKDIPEDDDDDGDVMSVREERDLAVTRAKNDFKTEIGKEIDGDKALEKNEISRIIDKVESFKAKASLLRKCGLNTFASSQKSRLNSIYKNIKKLCGDVFTGGKALRSVTKLENQPGKNSATFEDALFFAANNEISKLSAEQRVRFGKFYASSICEKIALKVMTGDSFRGVQDVFGSMKSIKANVTGVTNALGKAFTEVVHEMLVEELDSHKDR